LALNVSLVIEPTGVAYTGSLGISSHLLELDSRVEGVHQSDGVELGLDTLQKGAKEGRGSDDCISASSTDLVERAY
jgi:hypothetical protein